jgi:hypothetical protein
MGKKLDSKNLQANIIEMKPETTANIYGIFGT